MAGSSNVRAGGAFIELFADSSKLQKDLRNVQGILKNFGSKVATIGATVFAAGAAGLAAFGAAAQTFNATASAINDMSERTGVGAEKIQKLAFAAKLAGADAETLETGLKSMEKVIAQAAGGSKGAAEALAAVGLSAAQLAGMSPDQQMEAIADGLAAIDDQGLRAATAMEIFGKAGFKLGPMLKGGSAGLAAVGKEAERLGLVTKAADIALGDELGDTLDTLSGVVKQVAVNIGAALAPTIIDIAKAVTEAVAVVVHWVDQNRELVTTIAKVAAVVAVVGAALLAFGGAAVVVSSVIGAVGTVMSALAAAMPVISAVFAAIISPIGLIVIGVTAAVAALLYFSGIGSRIASAIGAAFQQMWAFIKPILQGIWNALTSGKFELAGKIAMAGLGLAWAAGVHYLNGLWQDFWYGALDLAESQAQKIADVVNKLTGQNIQVRGMLGAGRDAAKEKALAGSRQAMIDKRKELDALIAEAAVKPVGAAVANAPGARARALAGLGADATLKSISSQGSFSAREASNLGAVGWQSEVKTLLQHIARNGDDLNRKEGGLAFE